MGVCVFLIFFLLMCFLMECRFTYMSYVSLCSFLCDNSEVRKAMLGMMKIRRWDMGSKVKEHHDLGEGAIGHGGWSWEK